MKVRCMAVGLIVAGLAAIVAASPTEAAPRQLPNQEVRIVAQDMCCAGCARKVTGKLFTARGVKDVGVDLKTRTVTVSLPAPNAAMLGQLWHAVEQGDGGPAKLVTADAAYTLTPPKPPANPVQPPAEPPLSIVIDNLHCAGCANKIAAQLYTIKGVTKVSFDVKQDALFVKARPGVQVSPWQVIAAVAQAKERPLAVYGPHGALTIEWTTKLAPKKHHQAQQTATKGIQK